MALPAYFGLAYPAIWITMVALLLVAICTRHWKSTLFIVVVIAATAFQWRKTMVFHHAVDTEIEGNKLRILTYNVGIFNANRDFDAFIQLIQQLDADIVCLQEFGFYSRASSQTKILREFDRLYPYRHLWYKNQSGRLYSGLATFSRYPIVKKEKIQYKSRSNVSIYSDIVVDSDTIRIVNNHLESNRLTRSDRDFKGLLDDGTTSDDLLSHSLLLGSKLSAAMKIRALQAEAIRYTVSKTPYKTIVVGDFNDVPQSYTYRTVASGLTDAYATSGRWGYYWTFNQPPMIFPIDHILTSPSIRATSTTIHHTRLSDHYPMTADLIIVHSP